MGKWQACLPLSEWPADLSRYEYLISGKERPGDGVAERKKVR
jgi:hypothetical protein